jgi:hypothetical protein
MELNRVEPRFTADCYIWHIFFSLPCTSSRALFHGSHRLIVDFVRGVGGCWQLTQVPFSLSEDGTSTGQLAVLDESLMLRFVSLRGVMSQGNTRDIFQPARSCVIARM